MRAPLCLALRSGAVRPPRSPPLLWPLLTSRAGAAPSPFQALGEISPGKSIGCPCTSAGSTPSVLGRGELRGCAPARPDSTSPPIRLLFVAPQVARPAAFSDTLTRAALRFARIVATNSPEDFHLQVDGHAGHTRRPRANARGRGLNQGHSHRITPNRQLDVSDRSLLA